MSRLRAITARLGAGRKQDPEEQADGAAAKSATADEQHRAEAVSDKIGDPAASNAAALAKFQAEGAALREGRQPAASDAAPTPDQAP